MGNTLERSERKIFHITCEAALNGLGPPFYLCGEIAGYRDVKNEEEVGVSYKRERWGVKKGKE